MSSEPYLTLAAPCPPNSPTTVLQEQGLLHTAAKFNPTQKGGTHPGWASAGWRTKFWLALRETEAQNSLGVDPTQPRQCGLTQDADLLAFTLMITTLEATHASPGVEHGGDTESWSQDTGSGNPHFSPAPKCLGGRITFAVDLAEQLFMPPFGLLLGRGKSLLQDSCYS